MPAARTCSECGVSLQGYAPQAKTHNASCRQKRARRLRSLDRAAQRDAKQTYNAPAPLQEIMNAVNAETNSNLVKSVVREQLAPIVRDALTEDTLRAIQKLLSLTPQAVDALAEDLGSDDSVIRQRAYSLHLKYTVGHPALVKADDADGSKQIVVNFALDRPTLTEAELEAEVTEMRTCDLCDTEKPATEFVGSSERCMDCQNEWKQRIIDSVA